MHCDLQLYGIKFNTCFHNRHTDDDMFGKLKRSRFIFEDFCTVYAKAWFSLATQPWPQAQAQA